MGAFKKTDNHNLAAKLELRREFLKLHPGPLRVLDCFAGKEGLWSQLRTEFKVDDYLALDKKPRAGRLTLDSLRMVRDRPGDFNVIDLDAYGAPWDHWRAVLEWGKPVLVFLTVGAVGMKAASRTSLELSGVPQETPIGMHASLHAYICEACLASCLSYGFIIERAFEAPNPGGSARYFGLSLAKSNG